MRDLDQSDYERDGLLASWAHDDAPGGVAYTGPMNQPRPVVVVLEPHPGVANWQSYVIANGEDHARHLLASRTLVGWKAVHILPIPEETP